VLARLPHAFEACAFLPDGDLVLGERLGAPPALASARTGAIVRELEAPEPGWWRDKLHLSPDGQLAAVVTNRFDKASRALVWSTHDGRVVREIELPEPALVCTFAGDDELLVLEGNRCYPDDPARLERFDPRTGERRSSLELEGPRSFMHSCAREGLSRSLMALGGCPGPGARIYSTATGAVVGDVDASPSMIAFSDDGAWIAVGGSDDVSVWPLR
jgi:hypothetical protein